MHCYLFVCMFQSYVTDSWFHHGNRGRLLLCFSHVSLCAFIFFLYLLLCVHMDGFVFSYVLRVHRFKIGCWYRSVSQKKARSTSPYVSQLNKTRLYCFDNPHQALNINRETIQHAASLRDVSIRNTTFINIDVETLEWWALIQIQRSSTSMGKV